MRDIKDTYKDFQLGEPLTDVELVMLENHIERTLELVRELGPFYGIAVRSLAADSSTLLHFKLARGL